MNMEYYLTGAARMRASSDRAEGVSDRLNMALNQALALVILVLLSPVMAVVMFLMWRRDGGPFFYYQYRVGHRGQLFPCFKFRSMVLNSQEVLEELLERDPLARAEWARDQKLSNDPRITRIGAFLRRTSLDELPQLFNVVRGEMNLVGPRPITVPELTRYGRVRWHYLSVRPGMTGLWQVSGRSDTTYDERVDLDRQYVETRSNWMDLQILAKTAKVVVARDGAR
jgi:exopolysaccharide production protein ExoY